MKTLGKRLRVTCAMACTFALLAPADQALGSTDCVTWEALTTTGPAPAERAFPASEIVGRNIYTFGGMRQDYFTFNTSPKYNDLHRFDTEQHRWTRLTPSGQLPEPRATSAMAAIDDKLYVAFGGTFEFDAVFTHTFYDTMFAYDTRRNRWSRVTPYSSVNPEARFGPAAVEHDGKMYVFGGVSDSFNYLNDLWVYDPEANTWTQLPSPGPVPPGRKDSVLVAKDDSLVLIGGEIVDATGPEPADDVWAYDLSTQRWTQRNPIPQGARSGMMAAQHGGGVVLYGGDRPFDGPPELFPRKNLTDETLVYDIRHDSWTPLTPLESPPPLEFGAMQERRGAFYMFLGYDISYDGPGGEPDHQTYNNDVWRLGACGS